MVFSMSGTRNLSAAPSKTGERVSFGDGLATERNRRAAGCCGNLVLPAWRNRPTLRQGGSRAHYLSHF